QTVELSLRDAAMSARMVSEVPGPNHYPHETRAAERDERSAPRRQRNQPGDERRRHGIAEAREGVGDALRETTAFDRRPTLHGARRHRKRRSLADAEQQAHEEQRCETARKARENGRGRPDQAAGKQRQPRAKPVADPAAEYLKEQVRI